MATDVRLLSTNITGLQINIYVHNITDHLKLHMAQFVGYCITVSNSFGN